MNIEFLVFFLLLFQMGMIIIYFFYNKLFDFPLFLVLSLKEIVTLGFTQLLQLATGQSFLPFPKVNLSNVTLE